MGCMVGWDVSRHPEWDMMYAAGLTVREIADRCHQNCSTIHLHFRVREKYEPGFHARHEAALKARGLTGPQLCGGNEPVKLSIFKPPTAGYPEATEMLLSGHCIHG